MLCRVIYNACERFCAVLFCFGRRAACFVCQLRSDARAFGVVPFLAFGCRARAERPEFENGRWEAFAF